MLSCIFLVNVPIIKLLNLHINGKKHLTFWLSINFECEVKSSLCQPQWTIFEHKIAVLTTHKHDKQNKFIFQIKGPIKSITVINKHRKQLHYNHWKYMYK
jgi:hypothetical protein